jgi:hypothetical protein
MNEQSPAPKYELIEELVQGVVRAWRLRYPRSSLNQIAAEFRDVLAKWSASPQPPSDALRAEVSHVAWQLEQATNVVIVNTLQVKDLAALLRRIEAASRPTKSEGL